MRRVFETCVPRAEVLSGELTDDMFAAKLEKVVAGDAPDVYGDAEVFFARTYATEGLKSLLGQVLSRATDEKSTAAPIIRLETSFGGGKTHGLIALYHLARTGSTLGDLTAELIEPDLLPEAEIPFAAIVGTALDPVNGINHAEVTTYTMWGEIAYQLAGAEGYKLMQKSDEEQSRPGSGVWEELFGDRPAIICIDEIASFMSAFGRKHASVEQMGAFLHTLFGVASSRPNVSIVWTLATSGDAFADESEQLIEELSELASIGAREEIVLTPTGDTEYAPVINHRLFDSIDDSAAAGIADEFVRFYDQEAARGTAIPTEALTAEYRAQLEQCYPFHPALIDVLSLKTAALSNFQRTRGMLRLLAHVIRNLWDQKPDDAYFIQPYHVDAGVTGIRDELTSRLNRSDYNTVVQADIHRGDGNAHAQVIDAEWLERDKPPLAARVANTILLHSITIGEARGATDGDINLACGVPGLDYAYIEQAISEIYDQCWYIDPDRTRYRFHTDPQINRIIHDEISNVERHAAKQELQDRIRSIYGSKFFDTVFFAEEPNDVEDDAQKPKLVILDFDSETTSASESGPPGLVSTINERTGTQKQFRAYQNNILFIVADADQVENAIGVARRYVALSRLNQPTRIAEYDEPQQDVLSERLAEAELDLRVAVTRMYRHLFYPTSGDAQLEHHIMDVQDSSEADKDQEKVLLDLLHQLKKVLLADDDPLSPKYAMRVWRQGEDELSTAEFTRRFATNRSLPMVLAVDQFKRTIKAGAQDGDWVYYDGKAEKAHFEDAPPVVSIGEDYMLYTKEAAGKRGLLGEPEPPKAPPGPQTCPLCGKPREECTCGVQPPSVSAGAVQAEGTPKKAFQELSDKAELQGVDTFGSLRLTVDDVQELRVLNAALPQLVELQMAISVEASSYLAEFEAGSARLDFHGPWDELGEVRDFIQTFDRQADERTLKVKVCMQFTAPVERSGPELQRICEVLGQLELGKIELEGVPAEENAENG